MKIAAHPLMVAVALGLLGPGVLESADDRKGASVTLETATPPDAAEIARAERLWREARAAFDAERDA